MNRMKVKINNSTDWSTRDIRRVFLAAVKHEGLERDDWRIDVEYSRQRMYRTADGQERAQRAEGVMGYAYYNSSHIKLGLPNTIATSFDSSTRERVTKPRSAWRVAQLLVHELGHCVGLKHKDMITSPVDGCAGHDDCEWAKDMEPVRRAAVKVKPTATQEGREAKARAEFDRIEAHIGELEKKHKQAIRRWNKKLRKALAAVRRYDRKRIAAEAKPAVCEAIKGAVEPNEPGMKIPTVAAIKKACSRHTGNSVVSIDVGLRENAEGELTENETEWLEDSELFDHRTLADTLAGWRKSNPNADVSVDMYCYDRDVLIDNIDLHYADGVWAVGVGEFKTEVK